MANNIVIRGAGTPTGGGGGTPAPNITATVVVNYSQYGNQSVFGFSGVITLPTGAPNYSQLNSIVVTAFAPGSSTGTQIATLHAPFTGSTVNYSGGQFNQPTANQTWTLTFVCENLQGSPTGSSYTTTASVSEFITTSLTGGDCSALSTSDPNYHARTGDSVGNVHFQLWFKPVIAGFQSGQVVSVFYNSGDGAGWAGLTTVNVTSSGQIFVSNSLYVPTAANQTWQLAVIEGYNLPTPTSWDGQEGIVTLPSGAVLSSTFTVDAVGTIPATELGLTLETNPATGDVYGYGEWWNGNTQMWTYNFYELEVVFPASDPNLYDVRLTVQAGTLSGTTFTPATDITGTERMFYAMTTFGPEVQSLMTGNGGPGTYYIAGPSIADAQSNNVTIPSFGFPAPGTVHLLKVYGASRLGTNAKGGAGTTTLQTNWTGGTDTSVGWAYVMQPSIKTAQLDLSQATPGSVATTLTVSGGKLGVAPGSISNTQLATGAALLNIGAANITASYLAASAALNNLAPTISGQFSTGAGYLQLTNASIGLLTAGTASFTSTAIFSYSGGYPELVIGSGGITIYGSSTQYLAVSSSALSIVQSSTNYINLNSSGMTILSGSYQATFTASEIALSNGTQTLSLTSSQMTVEYNSSNYLGITSAGVALYAAGVEALSASSSGIILTSGSNTLNMSSTQIKITTGSNTLTATSSSLVIAAGSASLTMTSTGMSVTGGSTAGIVFSTTGSYPNSLIVTGSTGTSTVIEGNSIACSSITAASLAVTPGTVQVSSGSTISTLAYNSLTIGGISVISSAGVFTGNGVVCAGSGIECAGVNIYNGGTLYFGYTGQVKVSTTASGGYYVFSTGVNYMDFRGGVLCTV
jgi:hypothetical protein